MAKCVAEAVRLRAPGIDMRMAAADLMLPCSPGRPVKIRKVSPEPNACPHTPADARPGEEEIERFKGKV